MADEKAKPLPIIFEKSWQSGEVPRDWKTENFLKPLLIWKKKKKKNQGTTVQAVALCLAKL